ncbi:MAG: [acyl-carrier-protein] S-malonyltransferase [Legionellales bacterium RIFCSPHIGHO2_12_FULL_42_9]|nr:MAG: [acyl-carrier-protein] S-malonyltransferase [Legionellales bacterium RIFCSPHIGHO2_12_FULL_42_9]
MIKVAYVFPGQGSQSMGMLAELAQHYVLITDLFKQVSERLDYDVWALVQNGPESQLNQTEYTQAAMLTADVAIYQLLLSLGAVQPLLMAGHSLGEYAALVCAGALSLPDAAWLVSQRGRIMQECVPVGKGAMAAIVGLSEEQVISLCVSASDANKLVTPANFNAISQTVIAGDTEAVNRAIALAEGMGAMLARIIPVSVPCHCPLLLGAAEAFSDYLEQIVFEVPSIPVISNVDLTVYQTAQEMRELLKKQLYSPVRWVETIQMMKAKSIEFIVEAGPGKVLSGLTKRIEKTINTLAVNDEASLRQALSIGVR